VKARGQRMIEVWAHWEGLDRPRRVGTLYATPARAKEIFSFEYDPSWLRSGHVFSLDPSLQLFTGPQYPSAEKPNFGVFLDSSPDRWGRVLMDRREAQAAREEGRSRDTLLESDYLLGVYDGYRMGALRFRTDPDGPFLDDDKTFAAPPWTSIRELEHASRELERRDVEKDSNYGRWLRLLMAPGGSLGGARPKASVLDEKGHLWIAKFPSRRDDIDVGAWERLVHMLALRSGISVASADACRFGTDHHTFLTKRFDRTDSGERLHFASAMTLLGRTDGDDAAKGASYLELAEFLIRQGVETDKDLEELWRRIVFFICVSNVDDHLRNHGFLLRSTGWVLAPAYDMNPVPHADGLKLNISDADNAQDLELAREVAVFFRVKPARASGIIGDVVSAVKQWRAVADSLGIAPEEWDQMEDAFRVAETAS
jgi:serine/threonine-protein kinase HipA